MSHTCPDCGEQCYCNGDIDDCDFGTAPMSCTHCLGDDSLYNDDEDIEYIPHEYCPNCGEFYDDADFDFQICHICGYNADVEEEIKPNI